MEKLAVDGGKPVRDTPFPTNYLGVTLYGEQELALTAEVIDDKNPNRFYLPSSPGKVDLFEKDMREYFNRRFTLAVSSGTSALFCAAAALGLGPGDEVILPAFGWISDYIAITHTGALPVFADIDETLGIDPNDFERKITKNTKAVIMIYFQGGQGNLGRVLEIAAAHGIVVIEDLAQALGGEYGGKKLGMFGQIAVCSFQTNKMLCCGEGGLFVTDNEEYFVRAARYHDVGFLRPVFAEQVSDKALIADSTTFAGNQYHMGELCGAIMLAQTSKLCGLLQKCRAYHARIRNSVERYVDNYTVRWEDGDCGVTVFLRFKTAEEAGRFQDCLSAEGIPLGPKSACRNLLTQYPVMSKQLMHGALPPFGRGYPGEGVDYAKQNAGMNTDGILARNVAIAIGPQYTDDDIGDIIKALQKVSDALYHSNH